MTVDRGTSVNLNSHCPPPSMLISSVVARAQILEELHHDFDYDSTGFITHSEASNHLWVVSLSVEEHTSSARIEWHPRGFRLSMAPSSMHRCLRSVWPAATKAKPRDNGPKRRTRNWSPSIASLSRCCIYDDRMQKLPTL